MSPKNCRFLSCIPVETEEEQLLTVMSLVKNLARDLEKRWQKEQRG